MKINLIYAKMVKVYDYFPTCPTQFILHLFIPANNKTCGYYKNLVILELRKLLNLMIIHNKFEIHVF